MRLSDRKHRVALVILLASIIAISQVLWLHASREGDLQALDDDRFITYLDARIPELMQDHAIPGVGILLIKEGRELRSGAYGYADQESGRPLRSSPPSSC